MHYASLALCAFFMSVAKSASIQRSDVITIGEPQAPPSGGAVARTGEERRWPCFSSSIRVARSRGLFTSRASSTHVRALSDIVQLFLPKVYLELYLCMCGAD